MSGECEMVNWMAETYRIQNHPHAGNIFYYSTEAPAAELLKKLQWLFMAGHITDFSIIAGSTYVWYWKQGGIDRAQMANL